MHHRVFPPKLNTPLSLVGRGREKDPLSDTVV
jgi:hypothetical protein